MRAPGGGPLVHSGVRAAGGWHGRNPGLAARPGLRGDQAEDGGGAQHGGSQAEGRSVGDRVDQEASGHGPDDGADVPGHLVGRDQGPAAAVLIAAAVLGFVSPETRPGGEAWTLVVPAAGAPDSRGVADAASP